MRVPYLIVVFLLFKVSGLSQYNGLADTLRTHNLKVFASVNSYDHEHYNRLVNQSKFALENQVETLSFLQSKWQIHTNATAVAGRPGAIDYTVAFKCMEGYVNEASVAINIEAGNWSENNFVLMPAAAYNGNRYQWRRLRYSPKLHDIKDIGVDKPIILTDIPKLSEAGGVSRIQERSGSMTTPSIGILNNSKHHGIWLLTTQGNSLGDYGMGIEENRSRSAATMSITSPVVREDYTYMICDARQPSWDVPASFKKGDSITITFRLYLFDAYNEQSLYNKFAVIRKDISGDASYANTLSYSECFKTLEQKFNEKNYVPQFGYYSVGLRENYLQDWQIGWTGGMISTYPLLFAGDDSTKKNVSRNFDWLFPNGISPSGFYWDAGQKGTEWFGGDIRNAHTKNWHLIRKSGDAVWYIVKQFMLMEKMNLQVKQAWKDGNRKVCDAFVKLWNRNRQLGQFVDSQTGDIIVGGSSSGAIVPAALALAANYYHEPQYLSTAIDIANYYNDNFTKKGISCGGPGDALQNFDSESSYALVESYVTLYEATANKKWLAIAEDAANQFATWVVSYNYNFPDTSVYHKANIKTIGSVYANTQNKHAAPGICTASGIALLKLARYTGKKQYIQLLYDIAHHIPQYLPHASRPLGNAPIGFVSERINMTDWEGPGTIGYVLPISTWAETSLMLTTVEIPGLYVVPDEGYFVAFDNVDVQLKNETSKELTLLITNRTLTDATISILQENKEHTKAVMGENVLYNTKKITIKAGSDQVISFKKKA